MSGLQVLKRGRWEEEVQRSSLYTAVQGLQVFRAQCVGVSRTVHPFLIPRGIQLNDSVFVWTDSSTQRDGLSQRDKAVRWEVGLWNHVKKGHVMRDRIFGIFYQLTNQLPAAALSLLGMLAGWDLLLPGSSVGTHHTQHIISVGAPQPRYQNHSLLKYPLALCHSLLRKSGGPGVLKAVIQSKWCAKDCWTARQVRGQMLDCTARSQGARASLPESKHFTW